ncbi:Ribonuclease UK114 [Trichoplax sp. H2]|uniref:2-iminobutanoate/2-iminopropanoate deaminase n=1 Tax=Trichoplax adhaerens TaxID=10228 RepID=B3S2N3_TRIAD|nr:expressed hypothetical protein [Trichoplax adhaerens]EDV23127.1 expressed hypothetical protein [Trichoplax adhaerens]RDD47720.1 Ribonuclease UK114 [Trichoplax sp. H2]|eukprot:XP_002114037.1 expressed hypothetical protein [Trichoplax adhaerens]
MSLARTVIKTAMAPGAIGPYSQALKVGNTLYLSGQIGLSPESNEFAGPDVEAQTNQALQNIRAVLKEAGSSFKDVVKTTILLADINDFATVNKIYAQYFSEPYPARAAYECSKLPKLARIEIEAIAVLDQV